MKKNDRLFLLIKSLTKSEKRFFKIYSARHVIGDKNKYVQLFDAIDRQKAYNEAALLKKFKNEKFINRLTVAKAYLYELILRSMNSYHTQNSVTAQLREFLGNITFLYEKGLYEQATKIINKSIKLIEEYEYLSFLPEIIHWQKKLIAAQSYISVKEEDLHTLHNKEQSITNQLHNINDYWLLQAQLYHHQNHRGLGGKQVDLDRLQQLMQHDLLANQQSAGSLQAQIYRYRLYATYYFITRNFPDCYTYSKKIVALLEEHPKRLALEPMLYVQSINNVLNISGMLGKAEEKAHYLGQLQKMMEAKQWAKVESVQIKLFESFYYHSLTNCINEGYFEQGVHIVEAVEKGLHQFAHKIDVMGKVMLCFYSFHICFYTENFERAHQWLQQILAYPSHMIRQDIYLFAHLLNLLSTYEQQNKLLLQHTILKTYRFLYQKENTFQLEKIILDLIRQLPQIQTIADFEAILPQLQQQLLELKQDSFERKIFAYFDFVSWIQSKISKQKFADILTMESNP